MDLRSPGASIVASVMTYGEAGTSNASLVAVSDSIVCESGVIPGSSISKTSRASFPSPSTPGRSIFHSISIHGSSTSSSSDLVPTPGIYTYPIISPCLSMKVNWLGWSLPNLFTRAITVSGMVIKSQLFLIIFFLVFRAMKLYQICRFPLVPSQTSPLVL